MSAEIKGTRSMLEKIRAKYGETKMLKAQDRALRRGAQYFTSVMKEEFEVFRDTGATIDEMTTTEPYFIHGQVRIIKVYWSGSKSRQSIIHINEYGSVKNTNPRGRGAIARTMYRTEEPYKDIIRESLRGDL
ncbi:hypothetical protein [Mammaliicoccus vitulinus]|uniref:Uncharacterized protein n=1 Tax=Mammaliicoccus vitulinus TaxID=71237 RepID=A0ABX7HFU0_9STAP|nr:hypothetical protein [Mammaliicoccus vitulinus]PNZ38840.1 hypothetical protein CD107_06045 [Mammaliicoccus vitulinus]QRO85127.1 hypothetical protein I6J37_00005 [Mammaliicoccus vitulinus]